MHPILRQKILFLDIETVPFFPEFDQMPEVWKKLWEIKARQIDENKDPRELYSRAAIYSEFGKIVCISCGYFYVKNQHDFQFRIKSFYGDDEKEILENFFMLINTHFSDAKLCAHNGLEFDFPYISRRALVNRIPLPEIFDNSGKKPWEVKDRYYDTMQMWRFGDYKNYTSLELLTHLFNIPSSKSGLDGSKVGETYWKEKNLKKIVDYCEQDVIALARIFLFFMNGPELNDEKIVFSKNEK